MSRQANIIINGKGGVGKSFFAVNFVQYLKEQGITHIPIDTDNENSTLKRFHPEAVFLDIQNTREIDMIVSSLSQSDLVVVDCRAASTDIFLDYFDELQIFDILQDQQASLTVISPVNHETDSIEQIRNLSQRLGNRCGYVIVRNQALTERFTNWDQSRTRAHVVEELGGREITMPRLYDWLVAELNLQDLTVSGGATHPSFTILDRQRLRNWQRKFALKLESVRDLLLPPTKPSKRSKGKADPKLDLPLE